MLSKGKVESIMTPFKIKHHMVCLNLLKQDKSPHFAKTNEIQVQMRVCLLVHKKAKVYDELHRQPEHGMLSWLTSKARPQAAKRQPTSQPPCVSSTWHFCTTHACHHQRGAGAMK